MYLYGSAPYVSSRVRRSLYLLLFLLLISGLALAAPKPPKAEQVLAKAKAVAAEQHKAIFLIFGASWCVPCRQLDKFLALPEISAIFDKYFVVAHLTAMESAGGNLVNPGANELLAEFGGYPQGEISLPFFLVLDEKASPLINSRRPAKEKSNGINIGFPSNPENIAWFLSMLRRGAPSLTPDEAHMIESKF